MPATIPGYLGLDLGTQGLSVLFVDESLSPLASADASYPMLAGLPAGCYEQSPADWLAALRLAMSRLATALSAQAITPRYLAIGLSGQMHGEVLLDAANAPLAPARLWCDARNEAEGRELSQLFDRRIPKRLTVARWLWTLRNRPEMAARTARLTTPTGFLFHALTGQHALGIGDASGMFLMAAAAYDPALLTRFAERAATHTGLPLRDLLPRALAAGALAGTTTSAAAALGLPEGIPVAPPEGDQPAALAGALVAEPGTAALSYGTSICMNLVGDRARATEDVGTDHFATADGRPLHIVWMRNGTTFLNTIVRMFQLARRDASLGDTFAALMPDVLALDPAAAPLAALPFMDDEPTLNVPAGGTAMLLGLNPQTATPAHAIQAALLASAYNLRAGLERFRAATTPPYPLRHIILSGGLTRTPALAQILADVFATPIHLLDAAAEGTAYGAAVLASYTHACQRGQSVSWSAYVATLPRRQTGTFTPQPAATAAHDAAYRQHVRLLGLEGTLGKAVGR